MTHRKQSKISQLINKGVRIARPDSIEIGEEVDIDQISGDGVVIHDADEALVVVLQLDPVLHRAEIIADM